MQPGWGQRKGTNCVDSGMPGIPSPAQRPVSAFMVTWPLEQKDLTQTSLRSLLPKKLSGLKEVSLHFFAWDCFVICRDGLGRAQLPELLCGLNDIHAFKMLAANEQLIMPFSFL